MTDIIKLSIIVAEGLDVIVHASIEDIEIDVELIDVIDNIYSVYDSEGRLLNLTVEHIQRKEKKKGLWGLIEYVIEALSPPNQKVVLKPAETEPRHKQELREVLIRSLASEGLSQEFLSKASLEELINKIIEMKGIRKLR